MYRVLPSRVNVVYTGRHTVRLANSPFVKLQTRQVALSAVRCLLTPQQRLNICFFIQEKKKEKENPSSSYSNTALTFLISLTM